MFFARVSAPRNTNSSASLSCPRMIAKCSTVLSRSGSLTLTSAPATSRLRATVSWWQSTATHSADRLSGADDSTLTSGLAPALMNRSSTPSSPPRAAAWRRVRPPGSFHPDPTMAPDSMSLSTRPLSPASAAQASDNRSHSTLSSGRSAELEAISSKLRSGQVPSSGEEQNNGGVVLRQTQKEDRG